MKKSVWIAGGAIVTALCASTMYAAQGNIKEGKWAMTMTMQADGLGQEAAKAMKEMESMPPEQQAMMRQMMGGVGMQMGAGGKGMAIKSSQCLTNDKPVPRRDNESSKCQETHTTKGSTVHFEVTCPNSTSTGEVTYHNESMQGTIKTTETAHGKTTSTTISISGQYEGPCRSS